ncbi:MAG: biopolymer transporter ExbD [Burkholderiaceae bacterium]
MSFGRLERSAGDAPMSDINMTPLIDVMLVLLVIFIITAPLLASSIRLDLPSTDAATPNQTSSSVRLALDRTGQVFLDDKPLATPELMRRLGALAAQDPEAEVQLRADAAVPYGRVVELLGMAQKAGLSHIGFVAEPEPAQRP